jgi:Fuc2NAc and GlcNAc transferase
MDDALLMGIAFAAAALATASIRALAPRVGLMDAPNERSSHDNLVPRGGGLAIVAVFLICLPWLDADGDLVVALLLPGALIAAVGLWDDIVPLRAGLRLTLHFIASATGLYLIGGLPPLPFGETTFDLGWAGHILALFGLVWMLNLFNFMDGIDGIAGVETVTVAVAAALLFAYVGQPGAASAPLLLAAATLGFLIWNFPRARIFMGDVGSGFLGLVFGLAIVHWAAAAPQMFWACLVLLSIFTVDTAVTLIVRLLNGHPPHEAHRSHAYQIAARRLGSHVPVTLLVGLFNLAWLLPVAWLVAGERISGPAGLLIACLPLVAAAVYIGAGQPEGRRPKARLEDPDAPH